MADTMNTSILMKLALSTALFAFPALVIADVEEGKQIYSDNCASCHGASLEGGIGSSFVDHIWNYGTDPGLITLSVKFGIANLEMPAWGKILTDAQIQSVVEYILEQEKNTKIVSSSVPNQVTTLLYDLKVEVLNSSLDTPWAMEFLDAHSALVTDRAGRLYQMLDGVLQKEPVQSIPEDIMTAGQAGLFDVVADPDYEKNGWIYLSYAHLLDSSGDVEEAKAMTRIIRGRIQDGQWIDQEVLYQSDDEHYSPIPAHFGGRIVVDADGYLYFSIGDRYAKTEAQDITRPNGKIHRINKDGTIPGDNPFVSDSSAIPSIYSFGHRNPQGLALDPVTNTVWSTEHGPWGGDELNRILPGENYGWPVITYGHDYDGTAISEFTAQPGMQQPAWYWTPSIAVFNLDIYSGKLFPKWQNNVLVSSLKYRDLRRMVRDGDQIIHEEVLLKGIGRMRSVKVAPDGAVYVLLNAPSLILRLTPAE